MILSRDQIKDYIEAGEILISPFNEDLLKAASYTFTLGGKLMIRTTNRGPYPVKLFPGIKTVKGIFFEAQKN